MAQVVKKRERVAIPDDIARILLFGENYAERKKLPPGGQLWIDWARSVCNEHAAEEALHRYLIEAQAEMG